ARDAVRRYVDIIESDGRYPLEAFHFLQAALGRAVEMTHGVDAHKLAEEHSELRGEDHPNHVSARQLSTAVLDLAAEHWGLLARQVLERWNIFTTSDLGEMVFLLVDNDLLQKTEGDRREDFDDLFSMSLLESEYSISTGLDAERLLEPAEPS
ncbi:MAG: Minf_1886 family protein, partial [Planctomycetota bacterium]